MRILHRTSEYRGERPVVALGKFDGVHIGHVRLLSEAVAQARTRGVEAVALTFDRHPYALLMPERTPESLITFEEKCARIAELGVDALIAEPFTQTFADQECEDYLKNLCESLAPSAIVTGYNYTFGRKARGDGRLLRAMSAVYGYDFIEIPPVLLNGEPVSSTAVRDCLRRGDLARAGAMLGKSLQK